MNKLAIKFAAIAIGILTFKCLLTTAQLYSNSWTNQPGYGYDSSGRYYGSGVSGGGYQAGGVDPYGRRYNYGGNYPGYNDDASYGGYGRGGVYGRDGRYYGYYNSAISARKSRFSSWLLLASVIAVTLKIFA